MLKNNPLGPEIDTTENVPRKQGRCREADGADLRLRGREEAHAAEQLPGRESRALRIVRPGRVREKRAPQPARFERERDALLALMPLTALVVTAVYFGNVIRPMFKRIQEQMGKLSTTMQESMTGIGVVKAFAREHGYVETLFGRRCHTPEIANKLPNHRAFAERAAINAPIQGSAADVIRRAMIRMPGAIDDLPVKMLLQVHDELLFEVDESAVDALIDAAREVMEGAAAPAVHLAVPLVVDAGQGANWAEAH